MGIKEEGRKKISLAFDHQWTFGRRKEGRKKRRKRRTGKDRIGG